MDEQTLAGVTLAWAEAGGSPEEPRRSVLRARTPRALADELVRAWSITCATAAFGSSAVSFEDPAALLDSVLGLATLPTDPSVEALEHEALRFHIHPSVAVVQLVALSRELHRAVAPAGPLEGSVPGPAIDRAINLAIAAILADLEQRGLVDPLTELLNRRALDRDLVELVRTSARHDRSLLVLMADLEGLKATNDTLGHSAGDERLRSAAATLSSAVRTGDNVYRIGGDEFVLVMPDLELRNLEHVLDRVDHATATALTWGCAWARIMPDVDAETEALRLLELADQRLLRYRWSESSLPIERDGRGEIVAGRFGPPAEAPRPRR